LLNLITMVAPSGRRGGWRSSQGNRTEAGGLLVVVPVQDVWVTANFKETQLRKMRSGQKAEVKLIPMEKLSAGMDSIAGATGGC
jgi:membrane fusion protein (multidrug efflux system)